LSAAVTAMVMNGNMQYAWTLFVTPMVKETGWKLSQVQWAFTLYIALGTFSMPVSGWMIDRIGPRAFMSLAGLLCGIGWAGMGSATSLTQLYVLYAIAGFGTAFGYGCAMSVALKWFPDKRGLASGISAAGYGAGATIFNPIFAYLIHQFDYRATFLYTGIASGVIMIIAAQFLQNPTAAEVATLPKPSVKATATPPNASSTPAHCRRLNRSLGMKKCSPKAVTQGARYTNTAMRDAPVYTSPAKMNMNSPANKAPATNPGQSVPSRANRVIPRTRAQSMRRSAAIPERTPPCITSDIPGAASFAAT